MNFKLWIVPVLWGVHSTLHVVMVLFKRKLRAIVTLVLYFSCLFECWNHHENHKVGRYIRSKSVLVRTKHGISKNLYNFWVVFLQLVRFFLVENWRAAKIICHKLVSTFSDSLVPFPRGFCWWMFCLPPGVHIKSKFILPGGKRTPCEKKIFFFEY